MGFNIIESHHCRDGHGQLLCLGRRGGDSPPFMPNTIFIAGNWVSRIPLHFSILFENLLPVPDSFITSRPYKNEGLKLAGRRSRDNN
jgi:hypothetical protein